MQIFYADNKAFLNIVKVLLILHTAPADGVVIYDVATCGVASIAVSNSKITARLSVAGVLTVVYEYALKLYQAR